MSPNTAGSASHLPSNAARIFAVDDEEMITTVVEAILSAEGYAVRVFQDPAQALQAFIDAHPKPDLLITDFVMGEMNGIELIEQCRRRVPDLPTLLLSGTITEDFIRRFATQPNGFLAKPFQAEQLLTRVQAVLRRDTPPA